MLRRIHFNLFCVMRDSSHTTTYIDTLGVMLERIHTRNHPMRYMKSDTGKTLYKCALCCDGLISQNPITRHMTCHARNNKYPCTLCDLEFIFRNYLKHHMQILTSENPYNCDLCGNGFISRNLIKTKSHVRGIDILRVERNSSQGTPH